LAGWRVAQPGPRSVMGGWSSLGPEVARLLSSPVDSKGGERRTWLAGRPVVAHFVCVCVPLRIELGPRNACAHDPSPARDGESVWEWSSTVDVDVVDVVDRMAWEGRLRGERGRGGVAGWRQASSGAAKRQCDGSLTAGDAAWTWATKPSIPAWHGTPIARAPGLGP